MSTQLFYVLVMCCEASALGPLARAGDPEGAAGWRWLVNEHEPDTARCHASLLLQILSYAFSDDTQGSLDTLDLIQKHEPSKGTPLAEPPKVALVRSQGRGRARCDSTRVHRSAGGPQQNAHESNADEHRADIGGLDKDNGKD